MHRIEQPEQNVHLIEIDGKIIYIVGTAHISSKSAELVTRIIHLVRPNTVCIELCESRLSSLLNPNKWRETDLFEIIKSGRSYVLMAQLVLASYQKRLADKFKVRPGEEMHAAIQAAHEVQANLIPIDRDIRITLKRAWGASSLWSITKIFTALCSSIFSSEELSDEDIERLKQEDALTVVMSQLAEYLPDAKKALIDERDLYLAYKAFNASGERIVAVVGAGHVPGVLNKIGTYIDIAELETIPKTRKILSILGWSIPVLICAIIAYGFYSSGWDTFKNMALTWGITNGAFAALGTALTLAHPLTIITAFFTAPFMAMHPMFAVGWLCGLLEAILRKPLVSDFENIGEQLTSLKGIWKNRITHVLLVVAFANLGSVVGSILGTIGMFRLL